MTRPRRGIATLLLRTATAATLVLVEAPAPTAQERDLPPPDRVYAREEPVPVSMLDVVCEAAWEAVAVLGAVMVQTSLDPVTGTPRPEAGGSAADRIEWIEAHLGPRGGVGGPVLSVEVRAEDQGRPPSDGPLTDAVAVRVTVRGASPNPAVEETARRQSERYLETLDLTVSRRLRSVTAGARHGATPTPWIGPPLEPRPLGPPELAPPRPPTPGP